MRLNKIPLFPLFFSCQRGFIFYFTSFFKKKFCAVCVHSQSRRGGGDLRNGTRIGCGQAPGRGRAPGRGQAPGRGRGRGKKQPVEKSVDELDKELESYHAEAMQT